MPTTRTLAALALALCAIAAPRVAPAKEAPLSWLTGRTRDGLRDLLRPGKDAARLVTGAATFLDDRAGGDDRRIDPGQETLHLARYLLNNVGALKPAYRLTRAAIERLSPTRAPESVARELRFDVEGARLARQSHRDRTARFWKSHFDNNKRRVLAAATIMRKRWHGTGRPLVMVLGAGSCADVPLRELVTAGNDVILVDLDRPSLLKGIAQLPPKLRRHVRIELRDLTEGAIDRINREAARIIRRYAKQTGGAARARTELTALFQRQSVDVPQLEGAQRVDLLVSTMLIGQLPVFPVETINRRFRAVFKEPLVRSRDVALAQSAFGDRLFDAHIEALADFVVRDRAVVYFSSDVALMPSYFEPRSKREGYGKPRPVLGYHGRPLMDLDGAFSESAGVRVVHAEDDHWLWDQEPAQLSKNTTTLKRKTASGTAEARVKKGFVRAVDSVILVPAD